jgi:serine/threonine protein kinase
MNQKPFSKLLKHANKEAVDLIEKLIVFNPDKRLTVEEILDHPYTTSIKDDGVIDPVYKGNINFDFD